jgi:chemotaxis protein histidine kinase CheA
MTASPPLNGHARPTLPVLGDWRPATPEPVEEQRTPEPRPEPAETPELVAQAQAEAIRAKAWADAEAQRIAAESEKEAALKLADAEADAVRTKAEEEARKLRLANDRAERKAAEEQAASEARIADHNRRRDDAERARREATRQSEEQQAAEGAAAKEIEAADAKWRSYAIRFAIVCGIVSLPVQMSFFWNPKAPWMAAAPIMLEGAAWVVHRGARAAVASRRPVWHYRTIVWLLAFVAAGVNLYHGLHSFDPGTALATAFASIAGPGVWDLHEHGRIRKRDGALTRRERKAQENADKAEAKQKAAEEKRRAEEKEAADKAAAEAAKELAERRAKLFPKVWDHAEKLATDLGETTVTEAIWEQAKLDVEGAPPGQSADVIRMRNAAEARVEAALQKKPVNTLSKTTNPQRAAQMPPGPNRVLKTRATRRPGDTPKYAEAARKQAAITARQATKNDRPNGN